MGAETVTPKIKLLYEISESVVMEDGTSPHDFVLWEGHSVCAVDKCPSDAIRWEHGDNRETLKERRFGHPIHTNRTVQRVLTPARSLPTRLPPQPSSAPLKSSRESISIDPAVREALHAHLTTRYAGTGVGYSEFIRRALLWDMADVPVPDRVQPDNRWNGTYYPNSISALDEEAQK